MPFRIVDESSEEKSQSLQAKFRIVEETPKKGFDIPSAAKKIVSSSVLGSLGLGGGGADLDQMLKFKSPEKTEEAIQQEKIKRAEQFNFFGYKPDAETIEKIRHPVGVSMKGLAKGLLGTTGDLVNFAQSLTGVKDGFKGLPTSDQVGKLFEKLSEEEFNPENIGEEFAERGFEFLGSIIGLGGPLKGTTAAKTIGRNILGAFAPAGASLFAEKMELPGWAKAATTIGTSFLSHRLTGTGLKTMENQLYKQAEALSKDATVEAKGFVSNLNKLIADFKKGGVEGSDIDAIRKAKDALKETSKGKVSVDSLRKLKIKINEAKSNLYIKDLGKPGIKAAKRKLNQVSKEIDNTIKNYKNPAFQKVYSQANQLHGGMAETSKVFNFISQNLPKHGIGAYILKSIIPGVIKGASGITAIAQTGKFFKALAKYPGYRKAYWNVLKNASKEEVLGTAAAIKAFNGKTEKHRDELGL